MSNSHTTAQDLLAVVPLLTRIMAVELREEAGEDTTMPQFRVLSYLAEAPLTVSAIARKRRVSFQSAGELVQSLVTRGWITRIPDPDDRRQSLLHLSDEGRSHYSRAQQKMLARLVIYMDQLDEAEQTTIQSALQSLHRVLVQEVNEHDDHD
ncbi:MAG: MarR family transcriptional regulator [Chloroflexi bacterium]|nr:MarR family transcriptional regulator [Chloroflexota bacterium]MCC6892944.1 MarR family transcriptional regulator [Anaerolineae bacterium]